MRRVAGLALALAGCNQIFGLVPADRTDAAIDAPVDADEDSITDASLGNWDTPIPIAAFATANDEQDPLVSLDGLELYAGYTAVASPTLSDIVVSRRVATNQAWPGPVRVNELSTTMNDKTPRFAGGDLVMYLASDRVGTLGGDDVYRATRSSMVAAWSNPAPALEPDMNSTFSDRTASPCLGATRFVFTSERNGQADLFEWVNGTATAIPVASSASFVESGPFVTEDCLTVYFSSSAGGDSDLWVMSRPSIQAEFSPPVHIDELASLAVEGDPWVSADGRHIIFSTNRDGTNDLYEAFR